MKGMPRIAPAAPKLQVPNYSKRTPIVNDAHFTDGPSEPTLQSAQFNPGQNAAALPNGPPKYVQPKGKRIFAKGLTNKRITQNI